MRLVKARLKARATSDGLVEVEDHVALGQEYWVDLDTIGEAVFYNLLSRREHVKVVVSAFENGVDVGTIPVEMLALPE